MIAVYNDKISRSRDRWHTHTKTHTRASFSEGVGWEKQKTGEKQTDRELCLAVCVWKHELMGKDGKSLLYPPNCEWQNTDTQTQHTAWTPLLHSLGSLHSPCQPFRAVPFRDMKRGVWVVYWFVLLYIESVATWQKFTNKNQAAFLPTKYPDRYPRCNIYY